MGKDLLQGLGSLTTSGTELGTEGLRGKNLQKMFCARTKSHLNKESKAKPFSTQETNLRSRN